MNLADAIRQAALRVVEAQGQEENTMSPNRENAKGSAPQSSPSKGKGSKEKASHIEEKLETVPNWGSDTGKLTIETSPEDAAQLFATDSGTGEPVPMPDNSSFGGGNAVRFEIFLSPDQLSCLFRALVSTQHSMLTLREAANYLRIPLSTLEQLATDSKIPALHIDGRWRFPKSGIDEWIMLQSFRDGEVGDAA